MIVDLFKRFFMETLTQMEKGVKDSNALINLFAVLGVSTERIRSE